MTVISALVYADDLILMAEKEQDLQKLLNSVQLTKASVACSSSNS